MQPTSREAELADVGGSFVAGVVLTGAIVAVGAVVSGAALGAQQYSLVMNVAMAVATVISVTVGVRLGIARNVR